MIYFIALIGVQIYVGLSSDHAAHFKLKHQTILI